MMCSLKHTYDSDPTPASPILTTAKSEPVVPPAVGVPGVGVAWSQPKLARVTWSRPELSGVDWSRSTSRLWLTSDYSGRFRTTPANSKRLRLWPIPDNVARLRTALGDSGQLQTIPNGTVESWSDLPSEVGSEIFEAKSESTPVFCQL